VDLSDRQQEIFDYICRNAPVMRGALAKHFKLSVNTIGAHVDLLRKLGLIEPTSFGRWSAWRMATTLPSSGPALKAYERAPSVWAYAARCAQEAKR
jgi:DeoR/GlpR family transcriptional regulator of sugar metabolism